MLLEKMIWLSPIATSFISYAILSLDEIGFQLQRPFNPNGLSHLPLEQFVGGIERNLAEVLMIEESRADVRGEGT